MKATSLIYPNVQKPLTVFGLPPILMGLVAGAAVLPYGVCMALDAQAFSLPSLLLTFAAGTYYVVTRNRADVHYANLILYAPKPWMGKRARILIAGRPLDRKERG